MKPDRTTIFQKISTVEEFLNANASALTRILRKVTANKSLSKIIEQSGTVDDVMSRKKNSGVIAMESPTNHLNEPVDDDQIVNEQIEETMESGKRAITSQVDRLVFSRLLFGWYLC